MEYDFQTLVSRKGLGSSKWNSIEDNKCEKLFHFQWQIWNLKMHQKLLKV